MDNADLVTALNWASLVLGLLATSFFLGMASITVRHNEALHNRLAGVMTAIGLLYQACFAAISVQIGAPSHIYAWRIGCAALTGLLAVVMVPLISMEANRVRVARILNPQ